MRRQRHEFGIRLGGSGGSGGSGGGADCIPQTETCDGLDNTCDGVVDEGCACSNGQTQSCYSGPSSTKGTGECQDGEQTCAEGAWGLCQGEVGPGDEACDGLDNDCDGQADEDLGTMTCGVGACANAVPSCAKGQPGTCVPGDPSAEVCDGIDNNCDGAVDDGDPGGGAVCATGLLGECAAGTTGCAAGLLVCNQSAQASAETCDGLDNNCDGAVDEGDPGGNVACDTGLAGVCAAGITACSNGSIACAQTAAPSVEVCDGIDNDCNNAVDDGNPGGGQACNTGLSGACAAGKLACAGGSLQCAPNAQPSAEVCGNTIDDDCDALVDEGLSPTGWETRITTSMTPSYPLQVLWTGSEYAVLYTETQGASAYQVIHLQRVSAAGALVGPPVPLTSPTGFSHAGRIAWNGAQYGFVYWTYEVWPDDATKFQRLASDGSPIGGPIDIDPDASSQPDIVWNGSEYAVTWMSRVTSQALFRRISSGGAFLSATAALGSTHSISEIAWTGTQYGVTWDLTENNASFNTGYFTRVNAAGAEIGSEQVVTPAPAPAVGCCGIAGLFDIAWNGTSFGILRYGPSDYPTFIQVSSAGVVKPWTTVINEQGKYPEILWNGSEYLATFWWVQPRLTFARLSPTGALIGRYTMEAWTHPNIGRAKLAWDGTILAAAWSDTRYGNQEISLARFAPDCQ
jgi:hypothetical protein